MITLVQLAELRSRLRAYVRCGVLGLVNLLVSLETLALSFPAAQDTKGRRVKKLRICGIQVAKNMSTAMWRVMLAEMAIIAT